VRWLSLFVLAASGLFGCKSQDDACLYTTAAPYSAGQPGSERLSARVILPDGQEHSTGAAASIDGGNRGAALPLEGSVSGHVIESSDGEVVVDACDPGAACEPALFRLSITAPGLGMAIPVGRSVSALWSFRIGGLSFSEEIAILDGSGANPADGTHALWLWAADPSQGGEVAGLFKVEKQQLFCNGAGTGTHPCSSSAPPPDDYAFRFSAIGGDSQVTLATGRSGSLLATTSLGQQQHLTVHDLRSYQSEKCDDYWNWAWWAAGHAGPNGDPE
jgi:hypothetical protein